MSESACSWTQDKIRTWLKSLRASYPSLPASVYRLQLSPAFGFLEAAKWIPYLKELGVEAIYTSPYFKASPGSLHGYDVTDTRQINPELGSRQDYETFIQALSGHGLKHIMDIVPNHMGIAGNTNKLWCDVLENGPSSVFAHYFDIDWAPEKELKDKVLIPILGDHYGRVLENQEIQLVYLKEKGEFVIHYWEHRLPVNPRTYAFILTEGFDATSQLKHMNIDEYKTFQNISIIFDNLPTKSDCAFERVQERNYEKEIAKDRLAELVQKSGSFERYIEERVKRFNGTKGDRHSFDLLDELLNRQAYRMAFWRVASEEINYRRFFDVNELAAIRIEDKDVFQYQHQLIFKLLREGKVDGLRVDHPDGLYDPPAYFHQLQIQFLVTLLKREFSEKDQSRLDLDLLENQRLCKTIEEVLGEEGDKAWKPLYVVIEKILDRKEPLPEDWDVCGTVGYDFCNTLNGIFVDRDQNKAFDEIFEEFLANKIDFDQLVYEKKKFFTLVHMSSEINNLAHRLDNISEHDRRYRDYTRISFIVAIREIIACFPVYRTYISPNTEEVSERDRQYIHIAVEKAKSKTPALSASLYDFLKDILLLKLTPELNHEEERLYRDFILRFQQLTGPIMAKGLEDTAFYLYNRLISLNEVGGDPLTFGTLDLEFHRQNQERAERWPGSLITTSTHDTKRSEDVRMRINAISEVPVEWHAELQKWTALNEKFKTLVGDYWFPRRNIEYFIYQTLIGVWPLEAEDVEDFNRLKERIWKSVLKSIREAKGFTSWLNPNQEYEEAVKKFLYAILSEDEENHFLSIFKPFLKRMAHCGMLNSLSALILKLGSPGVMDTYQGTELWDDSLVDPDNRRPVHFEKRKMDLEEMKLLSQNGVSDEDLVMDLMKNRRNGCIKLYMLWRGLHFRRAQKDLLIHGEYIPLEIKGKSERHFIAFMRKYEHKVAIAVAGRFYNEIISEDLAAGLEGETWADGYLILPDDFAYTALKDVFTQKSVPVESGPEGKRIPLGHLIGPLTGTFLTSEVVE